jgi:hypothetical protein
MTLYCADERTGGPASRVVQGFMSEQSIYNLNNRMVEPEVTRDCRR